MQRLKHLGAWTRGPASCWGRTIAVAVVVSLAALFVPTNAEAQLASVKVDTEGAHAGEFIVPLNKSQILRVDQRFGDLRLGNAAIADVVPLTDRTIYVLGKAVGATSLTVLGSNGRLLAVVDLMVTFDAQGLKAKLAEIVPSSRVEVRAVNNTMILSGTVASSVEMARIVAVAETFAPNSVRNLLRLEGSQQVLLEVRIAEMSRDIAKKLGINLLGAFGDFSFLSIPDTALTSIFAAGVVLEPGSNLIDGALDALENKSLVKTLAEPNLIALSGESARFLAGGEFPVPRTDDDGDTEITFKEFGVGLAFTPTVLEDGLINLIVAPEVSELDFDAAAAGIPGISTRKAETTIEVRDGQSFAIAGLISSDFNDNVEQVPFLGDVPVLGALFRSSQFQKAETELVIVVTPRLVSPVVAGSIALPTDSFVPPSEANLFLLGNLEGPKRPAASGQAGHQVNEVKDDGAVQELLSGTESSAGLDGPHGHILQ